MLYRLKQAGYQAYLVGGGVRDLLLGREPKDFDVATDAHPDEVRGIFRNCRLIGRRFRLAHVHFGEEIIEVATFRGTGEGEDDDGRHVENGLILRDNVYGTLEEDVLRRDFTVNALYYNIEDFSVVDFVDGLADLRAGSLRLLGDPEQRYHEDPVRMLRAIRFAAKLGFNLDTAAAEPLWRLDALLDDVPPARLFDEVLKLFLGGHAVQSFEKLRHYRIFGRLFPATEESLGYEDQVFPITFVLKGLSNTDQRVSEGKSVTPAFLFAILLWEPIRRLLEELAFQGTTELEALDEVERRVLRRQQERVAIPKRYALPMREIWEMQSRFRYRSGRRPFKLLQHPRFRAAYDFYALRAESGEVEAESAQWWARFEQASIEERQRMTQPTSSEAKPRRRRRRPRRPTAEPPVPA